MFLSLKENQAVKIVYFILIMAILIDLFLPVMVIINPLKWFETLHIKTAPDSLHIAFLYRAAAHWTAFNLVQIIALFKWRKEHYWLAVTSGVRFSDIFTDLTYWATAPNLSEKSFTLLIPPFLNVGMAIFLLMYFIHLEKQKNEI
jgi:heme/copper-type cytochrome/quinol oxidase subunit 4